MYAKIRALLITLIGAYAAPALAVPNLDGIARDRENLPTTELPAGFYVENPAPGSFFDTPVALAFAPDGRIFVTEKGGRVFIIQNGVKLPVPFIDLSSEVLDHWDRGLLGIELDPDFENNGYVYLLYTVDHDGSGDYWRYDVFGRLVRYTVSQENPNVADLDSRTVLIGDTFGEGIPACYFSHAPGSLRFGSDGTLFVGAGDAASFDIVDAGGLYPDCFGPDRFDSLEDIGAFRSQYLGSMAGKILRVDPATGEGLPSNPYFTGDPTDIESKVWISGLRNPFRFSVRPGGSTNPADGQPGALFIGDVGWGSWEELDVGKLGEENFGWPCYEGPHAHSGYQNAEPAHSDCTTVGEVTPPQFYWSHGNADQSVPPGLRANAIVGGDFYQGSRYPAEYTGRVFYSDYTRGWIATADVDAANNLIAQHEFASDAGAVVDLRYDPVTEYMYYVELIAGAVFRIRHSDENLPPVAVAAAEPSEGYAPLVVQFTGSDSYDPNDDPLTYAWDFGTGDRSASPDTVYTYTQEGSYTAVLTVTDDVGDAAVLPLAITVGNTSPQAQILTPTDGYEAAVGERVQLAATATDADEPDENLQYHWDVNQHHNNHSHPSLFSFDGPVAEFTVPAHGLLQEVDYLRIVLTVSDGGGLTDVVERTIWVTNEAETDITAEAVPIALVTEPSGEGNPDIGVIMDGVEPPVGGNDPLLQYDTYDGQPKTEDWIGYQFAEPRYFKRIAWQEGIHFPNGGWFESYRVEVHTENGWEEIDYLATIAPYEGNDGVNYEKYELLFYAELGDAIRIIGEPGGDDDFISIGELRVFEIPRAEFIAAPRSGESPLTVDFTDLSNVAEPTDFLWSFGDGQQSTERHPRHTYAEPGLYTVNLQVDSEAGTLLAERSDYIAVDVFRRDYADFADVSGLTFNGDATVTDAALRIVPADTNRVGTAFLNEAISIDAGTSFLTDFEFRIHGDATDGADGMVFMVQGEGPAALGEGGGGLGYAGIAASAAVELDIHRDNYDPNDNHVAVDVGGSVQNSLAPQAPGFVLRDGDLHRLWIEYDGPSDRLRVFAGADPTIKPIVPVADVSGIDLPALVGGAAYFGFGAGTSGDFRNHDVESWNLQVFSTGVGAPPAGEPYIASFSPASGLAGTRVLISGANLGGATVVDFGDVPTENFAQLSSSQLLVDVPFGAVSDLITVHASAGAAASADSFAVADTTRMILDFPDFDDVSNLQLNGSTNAAIGVLRLTDADANQIGSAFYASRVPLTPETSFSVATRFRLAGVGGVGAEGFAFVVQNDSLTALGNGGGGLGYGGLDASLAVEIDIHPDSYDPAGPHAALHLAGNPEAAVAAALLLFDPVDAADHGLWIDCDGVQNTLALFVGADPEIKPEIPLWVVTDLALEEIVGAAGWFGFTAATGAGTVTIHDIKTWRLEVSVPGDDATPVVTDVPPARFALGRVFPNPFNPQTTIEYSVPRAARVQLRIYALDGRLVRTLVDGPQAAGTRSVTWNGRDEKGRSASSGVYFVRFASEAAIESRKIVLLK